MKSKYTTDIHLAPLRVVATMSSTDDTRYVINGVLVEFKPGSSTLIVSTDGRRLCRHESDWSEGEEAGSFIIPSRLISAIPATWTKCQMEFNPGNDSIMFWKDTGYDRGLISVQGFAIDGNFPTWRMVVPSPMPTEFPAKKVSLNPQYLADALQAIRDLGSTSATIVSTESVNDPIVLLGTRVLIVLMPMRPMGDGV